MKRRIWIVPLLLLLALAGGCSKPASAGGKGVIVVLIDMTVSAKADADAYMKSFTQVLNAAEGGERIFVVPITASFVPKIHTSATMPAPSFNPVSDAKKLKEARLKLQNDVASLLRSDRPKEPGTAILFGLQKAGTIFKAEGEGPRTLVILSDMIEQNQLDFTTATLTPPGQVLDQLKKDGLLPELEADVFVAGITAGQTGAYQVSQDRFQAIGRFWAAYFERAGARVGAYDRDLLNFKVKR